MWVSPTSVAQPTDSSLDRRPMTDPRDAVQAQYEKWVYPQPISDLAEAIKGGTFERGDPALIRRKLWPRNVEQAALEMVRQLLETAPDWHAVHAYSQGAHDLRYDAGLVDTFLHKTDRAYTVPQVLQFARDNGLKFQAWLDNLLYSVSARIPAEDDMVRQRAETLEKAAQWELVELLWQWQGIHSFLL